MTDFERQVLGDLSELKTQMRMLIGNGQPGLIRTLQARVEAHEQFVQRVGGIAAAIGAAVTLLHLAINYLRLRH